MLPAHGFADGSDHAYLIDWGIAHRVDAAGDTRITRPGQPIGSSAYMAPERREKHDDLRSDIFSLAAVLFETLTGKCPFGPLGYDASSRGRRTPAEMSAAVPATLRRVVRKGLDPDPDRRFQTAGEFGSAAHAALQPVVARSRRRPAVAAVLQARDLTLPIVTGGFGTVAGMVASAQGWLDPVPWAAGIIGPAVFGVASLAGSRRESEPRPGPEDATRT
ncbi:hypothetical protein GCM10009558_006790 [Virgisporangium aurantiacum]